MHDQLMLKRRGGCGREGGGHCGHRSDGGQGSAGRHSVPSELAMSETADRCYR